MRVAECHSSSVRSVCGTQRAEGGLVRRINKSRVGLKRRHRKFAWIVGASAVVIALLYWEPAAVLYVLSPMAICALLVVVMFSDLEVRDKA